MASENLKEQAIIVEDIYAVVLAAGKGTRMPSPKHKLLQTICGESLISLVLHNLNPLPFIKKIHAIIGYEAESVEKEIQRVAERLHRNIACIYQTEQKGTGHALIIAEPFLPKQGRILVVNGDAPLLSPEILTRFVQQAVSTDIAFLTLELDNPAAYGRVIRQNGKVSGIVEFKDFDESLYGKKEKAKEINAGIYLISLPALHSLLPLLTNNNKSKEYYITDLVSLGLQKGFTVSGIKAEGVGDDGTSLLGVNTPAELHTAEGILQERICAQLLKSGVILHNASQIMISPFAKPEPGSEISGPSFISGYSSIAFGVQISPFCTIKNAIIGEKTVIREYSHIEDAIIGDNAVIGPFARIRPKTEIDSDAHVGNFVELKKTRLGKGSKANHLSYLGDAVIGEHVNIGAGTITCNYDGKNKFSTIIKDFSFIGSNTAIVAPVTIESHALIGAGSVIVEDVPENTLAIARGRQVIKNKR